MDNLTHTAVGLFLSRVGLRRWTPLATPILLLAANAPDIDVVTAAGGALNYFQYHRHLTHSLAAMPVMALLPVAVVRLAARKPVAWMGAFWAAMIAVASHLLLDLTNIYGVRLLLPFSGRWFHLDLTSVTDLWIWGALLLAVAGPFIGRLVGSEIASTSARPRHYGRGFAWFALSFLLLYNCVRGVFHARALAELDSRLYDGATPLRVMAAPEVAAFWRWRGLVETRDFYAAEEVNLAADFDPTRAAIFHKPEPNPAIDAARRTRAFQVLLNFAEYPYWVVLAAPEPQDARQVQAMDLRFPNFLATALVDGRGQVLRSSFTFGQLRPR